jgi:cyclophilin family peptidyl-prolyl cis-trans isomerase
MQAIAPVMVLFSILFPGKMWYSPDQPLEVQVRGAGQPVTLVLVDFLGKNVEGDVTVNLPGDGTVDLKQQWPQLRSVGTYVLMAVPQGKAPREFIGTPLLINVRPDKRRDAPSGPMVIKVEPLRYAQISTGHGDLTAVFYYDVAPHTVANFTTLADGGFYDGLQIFRIAPDFVMQTGDPRNDGTGGPGYTIDAEFSSREHREGVLSMARQQDPIERQGAMPRADAANSAGSQFFICLNYQNTMQLDNRYTAFGKILGGEETIKALASVPLQPNTEKPLTPPIIRSIRILPVTAANNPYASTFNLSAVPTSQAAE